MPRAHHYRDAAAWLRRLDGRIADDWATVRAATGPRLFLGGPAADVVEGLLVTAHDDLARARAELARLALICDRRAEICAGYAADLIRHGHLGVGDGAAGPYTPRPAWWVEP